MFSQYFGYFLLNKGCITTEQLQDIFNYKNVTHVKLGLLAASEGYMDAEQVEQVYQLQTQQDKKFGELAIELGYLSQEQLYKLLQAQRINHLLFAEALVERGYMNLYSVTMRLAEYKKEHGLNDQQFTAIRNGDIDTLVDSLMISSVVPNKIMYRDYVSLFCKNLIRFIDQQIWVEVVPWENTLSADWLVSQHIRGEMPLFTHAAFDTAMLVDFAARFAGEPMDEADELAQSSVAEFLNLHNGIFLVNMSNRNIEMELTPQNVCASPVISGNDTGMCVKVNCSAGSFYLFLSTVPVAVESSTAPVYV